MQIRRNLLSRAFPLFSLLRGYTRRQFTGDLRAGMNVALLALPQAMAYAVIAGLPIQYGVFGAAVAAMVGPLFSTSRYIVLGPTNATAVMLMGALMAHHSGASSTWVLLPTVLFLVGLFLILAWVLKAATLNQFVSSGVVTGYITAAACLIVVNQIKNVLGFKLDAPASTFVSIGWATIERLDETRQPELLAGVITLALYLLLSKYFPKLPHVAITLVTMAGAGAVANHYLPEDMRLRTFSAFQANDWTLTWPSMGLENVRDLSSVAMAIAFLAILETTAVGKSLAARSGDQLDANREMLSLGFANLCCGFLHGMPASGSPTRSALNWSSGARSPLSSFFSGFICAIAAISIGGFVGIIPRASLAVLVISIGISLVNMHQIRILLRTTRSDASVFLTTFGSALVFRLDTAIFFGTGISLLLFLRKAAMPELVEYVYNEEGNLRQLPDGADRDIPEVSIVHAEGNLFFGAAELFRNQMRRICNEKNLIVVILKMRNTRHLDATSAMALEELALYMRERGRHLLVSELRDDAYRVFRNSGLLEVIGEDHIFRDDQVNPAMPTALAAKRAKELVGGANPNISIYINPET